MYLFLAESANFSAIPLKIAPFIGGEAALFVDMQLLGNLTFVESCFQESRNFVPLGRW